MAFTKFGNETRVCNFIAISRRAQNFCCSIISRIFYRIIRRIYVEEVIILFGLHVATNRYVEYNQPGIVLLWAVFAVIYETVKWSDWFYEHCTVTSACMCNPLAISSNLAINLGQKKNIYKQHSGYVKSHIGRTVIFSLSSYNTRFL